GGGGRVGSVIAGLWTHGLGVGRTRCAPACSIQTTLTDTTGRRNAADSHRKSREGRTRQDGRVRSPSALADAKTCRSYTPTSIKLGPSPSKPFRNAST